jgi:RNA recognition motif-containing protein
MRIFCTNVHWTATEQELRKLFETVGPVEDVRIIKYESGRSKGFAFLEMQQRGEEAIRTLNGHVFQGRPLKVEEANPKGARVVGS